MCLNFSPQLYSAQKRKEDIHMCMDNMKQQKFAVGLKHSRKE